MKKKVKKIKVRKLWNINPKTRVKESNKKYRRAKKKRQLKDLLKEVL